MKPTLEDMLNSVAQLSDLLDRELELIRAGDIQAVVDLTQEKHSLVMAINRMQDEIAEKLKKRETAELKEQLQAVFDKLSVNQERLEAMIQAIQDISSQFQRLQERQKENGLYGRRGKKMRSLSQEESSEIDGSI